MSKLLSQNFMNENLQEFRLGEEKKRKELMSAESIGPASR